MLPFLAGFPTGDSSAVLNLGGPSLKVFVYKPRTYKTERILMVFHGTLRNASEYRDHSHALAERTGMLVVAPEFPKAKYPGWRYNRGGVANDENQVQPPETWTYAMIPKIVKEVRDREGRRMPWIGIGHSAGGQFVVRMAAFADVGAERLVAANPGSLLFPRSDWTFGYGFGGLGERYATDEWRKRYLRQPLVIYQGTADDKPDEDLDISLEANLQGPARYQRGQAAFMYARGLAASKGWPFKWRLVSAGRVPHDHEKMFDHSAALRALLGP